MKKKAAHKEIPTPAFHMMCNFPGEVYAALMEGALAGEPFPVTVTGEEICTECGEDAIYISTITETDFKGFCLNLPFLYYDALLYQQEHPRKGCLNPDELI